MSGTDTLELFNQAWVELYCPPVRLTLKDRKDQANSSAPLSVSNGTVYLNPEMVPLGCDPRKYLLWYFRHELTHAHHCPHDIRTAYSLERAAYYLVSDWNIAYLATAIFTDMEVNLNYLLRRFGEVPYTIQVFGSPRSSFVDEVSFEAYNQIEPTVGYRNKVLTETTKEILTIMRLSKPWHVKVQMLAIILNRLKMKRSTMFSKEKIQKMVRDHPIIVREDFQPNTLKSFEDTFGSISNAEEAREFFEQWVEPRMRPQEIEKVKGMLKENLKDKQGKSKTEKESEVQKVTDLGDKKQDTERSSSQTSLGEEPLLPTAISRSYRKLTPSILNESLWKRYWYRSRAESTIIRYLSESPNLRPVWSVTRYPDEWYIEDDLEKLDIEMSLDEGPLIPEVTTLKWIEEHSLQGQSIISGFVPSCITVLDGSNSMSEVHDGASIAAFIAYLSALKAGGETSTLAFSTRYVVADWGEAREMKELTLSMNFGQFTVFPAFEIMRLASANQGNCFIVIITDGGWQNIDEAVPILENISEQGHKVFIFHLPGGEYGDRIERIRRSPHLQVYKVDNPETDLQNLVLAETMKTYKSFLM